MEWYVDIVIAYPITTAMIQFAILGTLGDFISKWIINKKIFFPVTIKTMFLIMIEWAFLAVCIKYAFTGFQGFIDSLVEHALLPEMNHIIRAFAVSTAMNLQFGPFLVIMHRVLDNAIAGKVNWKMLDKGLLSLIWFWIPAQTVTFSLPKPYQIGLAAVWSLVLGVILGLFNRRK
ncbi:MAG: hypothetical protein GY863_06690 [bacterium]|nr:hypothetical protein [bacterium]